MFLQTKLTSWAQRDTTSAKQSHSRTRRKSLSFSDPETLWTKIKDLKALLSHKKELYASKEVKENAFTSEGKSCQPEIQKPQEIKKRVMTSQC